MSLTKTFNLQADVPVEDAQPGLAAQIFHQFVTAGTVDVKIDAFIPEFGWYEDVINNPRLVHDIETMRLKCVQKWRYTAIGAPSKIMRDSSGV